GRLPIDARRAVYLVRVGEIVYIVGASENGLARLGEVRADSLPSTDRADADGWPRGSSFATVLSPLPPGNPPPPPAAQPRPTPHTPSSPHTPRPRRNRRGPWLTPRVCRPRPSTTCSAVRSRWWSRSPRSRFFRSP